MMKKMIAGPMVAGALLLGTATMVDAHEPQTTPVDEATSDEDSDDSNAGLWGLLGLLGLAGLAGLKRRDPVVRYDNQPNQVR